MTLDFNFLNHTTNALKEEKEQALEIAEETIKKAKANYILNRSLQNTNALVRALVDKITIINYYDQIQI